MHQKLHLAQAIIKTQIYGKLDLPPIKASLAKEVLFISEMYQRQSTKLNEIWRREELALAYIGYYLPLNWLRLLGVIGEGQRLGFFNELDHVVDFGSGPGTFHFAAIESQLTFSSWSFIEHEKAAQEWHKRFFSSWPTATEAEPAMDWFRHYEPTTQGHGKSTLGVFSYSLNEVPTLPQWAFDLEALCIVEPSTAEAGRRLQELRQKLIEVGYTIWAPCTHHGQCPLLTQSKTDWCHHRIHVELPPQVEQLETKLPIKNTSLTYSYLLARRKAQASTKNRARVIGDTLFERGKVRQAVCRGPDREFLSWLTRFGEPEPIARGSIIEISPAAEIKGSEIRLPRETKD